MPRPFYGRPLQCAPFNSSLTVTKLKSAYMPDSAMLPHTFLHERATYVVSFKPIGDQWRAALYQRDDGSIAELGPIAIEDLSGLSGHAIRAGYIGLAGWLAGGRPATQAVKRAHLAEAALYIPSWHPSRI